jgi:hypothetical protein
LIAPLAVASGTAGLNGLLAFGLLYGGGSLAVRRLQAHAPIPATDAPFADRRSFYLPLAGWWSCMLAYAGTMIALSAVSHRWVVTALFVAGSTLPVHCTFCCFRGATRDA